MVPPSPTARWGRIWTAAEPYPSWRGSVILAFEQLLGGARRVEHALDHALEQVADGGVVHDGRLQAPPHPRSRQLENLVSQVPRPPLLQRPLSLDVLAVLGDLLGELRRPLTLRGLGLHDRDSPRGRGPER